MSIPTYNNFDLLLYRSREGYGAKVLASPAGEASTEVALPLSEQERQTALRLLGRTGDRGTAHEDSDTAGRASQQEFGGRLYEAVFAGKVGVQLRRSLDLEMPEADWCCGSAGIYNVTQPELSRQLLHRKMEHVRAAAPDILVTANPGCLMQLQAGVRQSGLRIEVLHLIDLLDRAYTQ